MDYKDNERFPSAYSLTSMVFLAGSMVILVYLIIIMVMGSLNSGFINTTLVIIGAVVGAIALLAVFIVWIWTIYHSFRTWRNRSKKVSMVKVESQRVVTSP